MFSNRFNTKNDPILEAVEGAMKDGALRRQAEAIVNEDFGVYSRNAVVREDLNAYDATLEEVYAALKEGVQIDELKKPTPETAKKVVDRSENSDEWSAKAHNRLYKRYKDRYEQPKPEVKEDVQVDEAKKYVDPWTKDMKDTKGKYARIDGHYVKSPKGYTGSLYKRTHKGWEKGGAPVYDYKKLKEEKADKDYDKDGKIESGKDEVWGSRLRAAKMAGKLKEEEQIDEVSKKTAIRAYRERESQHRGEYNQGWGSDGQNPNDDYGERSGKKASKTLSRIGKKFGAKTAAQAKRGAEVDSSGRGHGGKSDYLSAKERVYSKFSRPNSKKGTKERKEYMSMNKGRFAKEDYKLDEAAYSAKAGRAGKDLGKPGKNFSKIADKVGGEKGKRVAGAILKRIRAKHMKEDAPIDESAFGSAFAAARKGGQSTFSFGGKSYNTKMASSSSAGAPKPTTSLASKPMGNMVSKLPSSGMSAGTAAARTSGSSLPSMASGASPTPVKPTSKFDKGSTHTISTYNPSSPGQQATVASKRVEKGWADAGEVENKARATGSMQQQRDGKVLPPSAELGTPKSMDPVQGGVSSAPTKMPAAASSTSTPGSMKISAQPAPSAGPSGADKMKTMASLKESVQVGANKYRIV